MLLALFVVASATTACVARAADWPGFRRDNSRSSQTDEKLDATQLGLAWTHRPQAPQPAWDGPARWDAYGNNRNISSMRDYDEAYHVIVVGKSLYYSSSADDAVHCLDTQTGAERWAFVTEGPVRIVPSFADGRLYFGSDDGFAYCITADSGQLVWKFRPAAESRSIINDGHLNSLFPVRTGVLVDGGTAYCAASLLPWEPSYLAAVDAATGKPDGAGRYVVKLDGLTMEGALLATPDRLVVPQGRVAPVLLERASGRLLGPLSPAGGGCFVLLTPQKEVLHGPGNRGGAIVADGTDGPPVPAKPAKKKKGGPPPKVAQFPGGRAMVATDSGWYLMTQQAIAGIDPATRQNRWQIKSEGLLSMALAGDTLFVGSDELVSAYQASDGKLLWEAPVPGRALGLAIADGALWVSADDGTITCFRPGAHAAMENLRAPLACTTSLEKAAIDKLAPPSKTDAEAGITVGPYAQFTSPGSAVIRWQTAKEMPTTLDIGLPNHGSATTLPNCRIHRDALTKEHEVTLTGLRRRRDYAYQVETLADGQTPRTPVHTLETYFNYTLPTVPPAKDLALGKTNYVADKHAEEILNLSGGRQGICLLVDLGAPTSSVAWNLARRSQLKIIVLESDNAAAVSARARLLPTGIYGTRIEVLTRKEMDTSSLPGQFANLIVCSFSKSWGAMAKCPRATEVLRMLRPDGGVAVFGVGASMSGLEPEEREKMVAWAAETPLSKHLTKQIGNATERDFFRYVRPALQGTGQWTHQYGSPSNASFAGESLAGAKASDDLVVQWIGRPGPRYQPDRSGRKPGPLAISGRLFAQGLNRLIALDQYNGSILWSLEMPEMLRMNMPRDTSNWCADEANVYAVVGQRCWQIDAASGHVVQTYSVVGGPRADWQYQWGYTARVGGLLLGSGVKADSTYKEFWGGENWYEGGNDKVLSDNLFALNPKTGKTAWTYVGGAIIDSTLCADERRVFFVESRSTQLKDAPARRAGDKSGVWQYQYHVALDAATGEKLWERPLTTKPGSVAFYQSYGNQTLVLVASNAGRYYIYAFDAAGGSAKWQADGEWGKKRADHGSHLSIPAIVGDRLYVRPAVYDLKDGKQLPLSIPVGGCGTYACTTDALFQRAGSGQNFTMWNATSGQLTQFQRLRPDCWLSTIPAGGMLLSPESGGGCSCGMWLETSVGFVPRTLATSR
ncbi:MAG: PQQ-binding-like beta-propeller repeat protein [Planctomycetia bacterium]|nr:PQQ-binding-like beta-propeller repeat protein [Planctomycetia bacterium]